MAKLKLLAISTSCFTASNREIYRRLNTNIEVHLVVPKTWNFGKGVVEADPPMHQDPKLIFLNPTKYHHRLFQLRGIRTVIDEVKPDIIYYEGDPGSIMAVVLGKKARQLNSRFFALSCENLSQSPLAVVKREGVKQFLNASIKYALIQISKRNIDTLFVINNEGLSYFKKLGFKNVIKTPLGFNEETFNINSIKREQIRKQLGVNDNTVVIAYFGRLVHEKGVHILIEALGKLKSDNWIFLIDEFGRYKTDYQAKIEEMIESSNFKKKTIFFEADHTEIADYMNASDITVLPSIPTPKWIEQYGRVVPEAMACGSLLIVSGIGAPKDFFEEGYPYVFTSGDVKDLELKINKAKTAIEQSAYDRKAFSDRALENYSLTSQINVLKPNANLK